MKFDKPSRLIKAIEGFNQSDNNTSKLAWAICIKREAAKYIDNIDENVLPMYMNNLYREKEEEL